MVVFNLKNCDTLIIENKGNIKIIPVRVYCGLLMTSLDSSGVHVSILKLPEKEKTSILEYLDAKTEAPGWPGCSYSLPLNYPETIIKDEKFDCTKVGPTLNNNQEKLLKFCLQKACQAIIDKEEFINELDRGCGDGDCGSTLKNLGEGIVSRIDSLNWSQPSSLLSELGQIAEERMGGTSGAIYSLMFTAAATEFSSISDTSESWLEVWARVWRAGVNGIMKYSKAKLGDKTMIDVLCPSLSELEKHLLISHEKAAQRVARVALQCSEATKNMIPNAGRASYVKQAEYLKGMDAGAFAVSLWINSIAQALQN